jgi:uncharacterized protein (TIGR03437 family)
MGKGDGTFQAAPQVQAGSPAGTPLALAASDLNKDGKLDLVVTLENVSSLPTIVVLLGNGDGTFRQSAPINTSAAGSAIAITDLNGDGIPDLVIGDCCGLTESVYFLGNGDGTFQAEQFFLSGASVTAFAVTSWNNDGVAGLAIAQGTGNVMAMESGLNQKLLLGGNTLIQVSSAAGGVPALAPGSLASAFGKDLANAAPPLPPLPWPIQLAGTSVAIVDSASNYTPAPLTYVSPTQVNFEIPDGVATGPATVTVTSGDGTVSSAQVNLTTMAPSLFTLNSSNLAAAYAVCVSAGGAQTLENPFQVSNGTLVPQPLNLGACSETVLELYGTGLDRATTSGVKVTIGNTAATVLFAGPGGGFRGLDQINVAVPQSLAGQGNVSITLTAGGMTANTVNVTIQ